MIVSNERDVQLFNIDEILEFLRYCLSREDDIKKEIDILFFRYTNYFVVQIVLFGFYVSKISKEFNFCNISLECIIKILQCLNIWDLVLFVLIVSSIWSKIYIAYKIVTFSKPRTYAYLRNATNILRGISKKSFSKYTLIDRYREIIDNLRKNNEYKGSLILSIKTALSFNMVILLVIGIPILIFYP